MRRHDDAGQILSRTRQPLTRDHQLVAASLDVTAAGILIILHHRCLHLPQRDAQTRQSVWVNDDLVLLRESAQGVDIREPWHRPQHRPDHPIVQRA